MLVYADSASGADSVDRQAVYHGLEQAGHRVTMVTDADGLSRALASKHFDVVIANFNEVSAVDSSVGGSADKPRMLPVVARREKNSPQVRDHFNSFLVSGAGLSQYLREIEKILPTNAL